MLWKRIGKILLAFLLLLAALVGGYAAYLLLTYDRIEDRQVVEVENTARTEGVTARVGETYTAVTYNVGFGAYSDDYSFFMDGGKYARAMSEAAVRENIGGDIALLEGEDPDLVLLQEVDRGSTRSYQVDEHELFREAMGVYAVNHGVNYHSAYLFYPLTQPHGASLSGLSTFSRLEMTGALRRSLPVSTSLYKFIDLDRCYVVTRIPVDDGKELAVYNVHLSAYTEDESIVKAQIAMLSGDLEQDVAAGNYVVCGGDFNQNLLGDSPAVFGTDASAENWAKPFPKELLPKGISVAWDRLDRAEVESLAPSCRNADAPYEAGVSFVTMVDGFLLSDNVAILELETVDNGFLYSDHNPVRLRFTLRETEGGRG